MASLELEILELSSEDGACGRRRKSQRRRKKRTRRHSDGSDSADINISVNQEEEDEEGEAGGGGEPRPRPSLRESLLSVLGKLVVWRRCEPRPHPHPRPHPRPSTSTDYFKSFYDCGSSYIILLESFKLPFVQLTDY